MDFSYRQNVTQVLLECLIASTTVARPQLQQPPQQPAEVPNPVAETDLADVGNQNTA